MLLVVSGYCTCCAILIGNHRVSSNLKLVNFKILLTSVSQACRGKCDQVLVTFGMACVTLVIFSVLR